MSDPNPTETQESSPISQELIQPFVEVFYSPLGLMMLGVVALWIWLKISSYHTKKGVLARGQLGTTKHRKAARKKAVKLMAARKHNEVSLYIGTPNGASFEKKGGKYRIYLPEDSKTVYIPGAEAHTAVVGATGCGKSFSAISPMVRSAIDQGFPIVYFDLKYTADDPNPSSGFMGYARSRGYTTDVFAPGMPESCVCNPLSLLRDAYDAEMARQFAVVLQKNYNPANSQSNPFFDQNAQKMIQGTMMLAKLTRYPDLMTARAIGRMPGLVDLIEQSSLPEVVKAVFDPLVSSSGAPETLSGIQATVANMLGNLMSPNLLPSLVGETTMPLDLDGRQFLSFGVDGQRRDVVLPMIATVMHLVINRNIQRARKTPLILVLDEIPAIYLPALADWLNQARSAGLCVILGFQSFALLEKLYGKVGAEELITGCTTQMVFQLNDKQSAETFSTLLGKKDVRYHQKSKTFSKSGSRTNSQQLQTTAVLETNEITTFPKGKMILFNRGYGDQNTARVPYLTQIKISKEDLKAVSESQAQWPKIRQEMLDRANFQPPSDADFKLRNKAAQELFSQFANSSEGGNGGSMPTQKQLENIEDTVDAEEEAEKLEIDECSMLQSLKDRGIPTI